jgi:hypothetical protein
MSGNSLRRTRYHLKNIPGNKIYAAIYVNPNAVVKPDIWVRDLPWPHFLEWNLFNSLMLDSSALDFDGILCKDCIPQDDDDGPRYSKWLKNVEPLYLVRKQSIPLIVTARLEKYREPTLQWMKNWGITCNNLVMGPWKNNAERTFDKIINLKSEYYRKFINKGRGKHCSRFFIESNLFQSQEIAKLSGGIVICPSAKRCFRINNTEEKNHVWVVGFPRCGSTSICKALNILGWNVIHNPRNLDELEKHNAAGDILITANWKVLYKIFPSAKFILNTRDFDLWFQSIQRLSGFWLSDMYYNKYYRETVYGTHNSVDRQTLKQSWDNHHIEIQNTIPAENLLIFHQPFEWRPICQFLEQPIPDKKFPWLNYQTSDNARRNFNPM